MKTPVVIAAVVGLHVAVIGGALLIGGCKSLPPSMQKKAPAPPPPPVVDATPLVPIPPPPPVPPAPVAERTYTVKKGDSLSKIAKEEGVSLAALLSANNLTVKSVIHPGQKLTISGAGASTAAAAPTGAMYVVKQGDSLGKIAKTHGTSVDALIETNHLKSDVIRVGQKLSIPSPEQTAKAKHHAATKPKSKAAANGGLAPVVAAGGDYTVQSGDSPGSIAKKFGIKADDLMKANNITDPKKLRIGQKLVIPGKAAAPVVATDLPPPPAPPVVPDTTAPGTTTPAPATDLKPADAGTPPPPPPPPPKL